MNFNGELFFGVNLVYSGNFTINGNVTVNGTALFADGKAGAPSIAFANETSLGFYRNALGEVTFTGLKMILDGDLQITQDLIIDGDVTLNGDLKCEDLTCQSITNSGTASNGTNAQTTGALSTTSISNSGTQSNGTNAQTTGALSTTSISNSGTQSNGTNAQTTGALSCTSLSSSGTAQVTNIASTSGSNVSGTFYTFASDVGSSLNSFANFHVTATGLATTAGGGMGVEVVGRNGAYIGVCRSNASLGQLPASTAYFTSGSNSNVSIGRGSGNLASTSDILINSSGAVAMTNGSLTTTSLTASGTGFTVTSSAGGSTTNGYTSLLSSVPSAVTSQLCGIGINIPGRGSMMMGCNKTTGATGDLAASTNYISSGGTAAPISIGRGASDLPNKQDILINTDGSIAMTNGQVSVASISIASTTGTTSQTRAVFLGTTNSQTITSGTTATTVTIWSTTAATTSGLAVTCDGTTFTVPSTGRYMVTVTMSGSTRNSSLWRLLRIDQAGEKWGTQAVSPPTTEPWTCTTGAVSLSLAASATFTVEVAQTDGLANSETIGTASGPVKCTITKSI